MITGEKAPEDRQSKVSPSEHTEIHTSADVKLISAATKVLLRVSGAAETLFEDVTRH